MTTQSPYLTMAQRDTRCLLAEIGACVGQDTRPIPDDEHDRRTLLLWFESEEREPQRIAVEIAPDGSIQNWSLTPRV